MPKYFFSPGKKSNGWEQDNCSSYKSLLTSLLQRNVQQIAFLLMRSIRIVKELTQGSGNWWRKWKRHPIWMSHMHIYFVLEQRKKESLLLLWSMTVCFLVLKIFCIFLSFTWWVASSFEYHKPVRRPAQRPVVLGSGTDSSGQCNKVLGSGFESCLHSRLVLCESPSLALIYFL